MSAQIHAYIDSEKRKVPKNWWSLGTDVEYYD